MVEFWVGTILIPLENIEEWTDSAGKGRLFCQDIGPWLVGIKISGCCCHTTPHLPDRSRRAEALSSFHAKAL
jgi:hypothetical protein